MPELPEVETTCRGIRPHLENQTITAITIRQTQLRWPISPQFRKQAINAIIQSVSRRAKYLLIKTNQGTIIIHLGMSGSLRLTNSSEAPKKHDHVDIRLGHDLILRFHDPRRFGAVLWTRRDPLAHKLLKQLGPEPLDTDFNAELMRTRAHNRKQAIKTFLMNSQNVVGVGNIYTSEALFLAGIHPKTAAGRLSLQRWQSLICAVQEVLRKSIDQGGTTLRDFINSDGQPGYFAQSLRVYGRENQPCHICQRPIRRIVQTQRATYYCATCQH